MFDLSLATFFLISQVILCFILYFFIVKYFYFGINSFKIGGLATLLEGAGCVFT